MRRLALAVLSLLLVACARTAAPPARPSSTSAVPAAPPVTATVPPPAPPVTLAPDLELRVLSWAPLTASTLAPDPGTHFVVLDVTLHNTGAAPVHVNRLFFGLEDDAHQVWPVTARTTPQPPVPTGDLGPDATVRGRLAFLLADGRTPSVLRFQPLGGDLVRAPLPAQSP